MMSEQVRLTEKGMWIAGSDEVIDESPLELDLSVIGRHEDIDVRHELSRRAVALIENTTTLRRNYFYREGLLGVTMSEEAVDPSSYRLGTRANAVLSPEVDDELATQQATDAMRQTACQVRLYESDHLIEDMVYAQVSREYGITLETNAIGSCAINTDGMTYAFERDTYGYVSLQQHNLYTHEMQLVCLSGLIALVNARPSGQRTYPQ